MKYIPATMIILALTGCASPQEMAQMDDQKCRSNGLKPGSTEYDRCRMALDAARQQQNLAQAMKRQAEMQQQNAETITRMSRMAR
jgi:hypothetical protein